MATPALIVVITVALGTLVALPVAVLALLRRLRDLSGRLETVRARLDPGTETVDRELAAARRRLDELDRAMRHLRGRSGGPRVH
ncbi:MAG: hypothetical protein ACRDUY_07080 [Nitriliruptorales bacterium]